MVSWLIRSWRSWRKRPAICSGLQSSRSWADLGPVGRGEALIAPGAGAAGPGIGVGRFDAVAAVMVRGIAAHLAIESAPVAAEQPGDGGHGDVVLAEPGQEVSFGGGDLGVHR